MPICNDCGKEAIYRHERTGREWCLECNEDKHMGIGKPLPGIHVFRPGYGFQESAGYNQIFKDAQPGERMIFAHSYGRAHRTKLENRIRALNPHITVEWLYPVEERKRSD